MLAVFVLRVRRPDAVRPYRAWGYPALPAVFVMFYLVFIVNLFFSRPRESGVGLLFILAGLIVYLLLAKTDPTSSPGRPDRAKPYNEIWPYCRAAAFRSGAWIRPACRCSTRAKRPIVAVRCRWRRGCGPRSLDEFVGQQHFLGPGKLLRRLLAADRLGSVIFYGPPGTGKTTLAHLLATASRSVFRQLSAVASGVKELREILDCGPRPLVGGRHARRCCSSTRSIASTRPSKTCCCPTSKRGWWCWSERRRKTRFSP